MVCIDSNSGNANLGARFRKPRSGPELNLIESFLQAIPLKIPRNCRATIFREPRLESGFPDLVIVIWREEVTRDWHSERNSLSSPDLRLMHYLHLVRRATKDELVKYFGKKACASIERLSNASMIRSVASAWTPCALRKSFAAENIIAVEAKIGKWSDVLEQAVLNTWFASKSYVLVPHLPSQQQLTEARRLGIGVCSFTEGEVREVSGESMQLPRSYASWMFNDWAWRSAQYIAEELE